MNANQIKNQLMDSIMNKAAEIAQSRADILAALIKYEISVANTELSLISNDHGYDFDCLSYEYANNIMVSTPIRDDGSITINVSIPQYALKNVSESEIEYLKTFVLSNAITKFKRMN